MILDVISIATAIFGVIMSLSYFLQAYRIWKRKSSHDVSIPMFIIFILGTMLYTVYGIMSKNIVITIGFSVGVVGTVSVMVLALKYRNK